MFGLGVIWGICMVSQDLFSYNLYLLLLNTQGITCQNFIDQYAIFLLATTIISGFFYPLSGWLTDKIKNTKLFFFVTVSLQSILFILQYTVMIGYRHSFIVLIVLWLLLQILFIQNNNLFWKIVKNYTCVSDYNNRDSLTIPFTEQDDLEIINRIGNLGDLTSDIVESIILSVLMIILMCYKTGIFEYVELYLFVSINFLNIMLLIFSSVLYYKANQTASLLIVSIPSVMNNLGIVSIDDKNENHLNDTQLESTITNTTVLKKNTCHWLINNTKKFYCNKSLFHIFWHCIILLIFSLFIQYPLSLKTINIINVDTNMNIFNLCGGKIINIMFLGSVTNICYLIGSITYRIFIVKMRPESFYKYWYITGTIMLLIISIIMLFKLNYIFVFLLISIATIIPYYLTYYDYYYFTERCDIKNYPYVLGLYGFINTILTFIIQYFFMLPIKIEIIVIIGAIIILFSLIYTFYIIRMIKTQSTII